MGDAGGEESDVSRTRALGGGLVTGRFVFCEIPPRDMDQ
jgi:hypothetical protein